MAQPLERRVVFGPTDAPVATVVILACRRIDELFDALEGLAAGTQHNPFNVAVVLNCDNDRLRSAVLEYVEGAVVIESPVSLSAAAAKNLGAAQARGGEFLAFLDDDATPEPAWLDNLIQSAGAHPEAGAICSRVHNPDGSLQEAGARILADPGGMAIGFGADVLPSELSKPRPVDYGGGEALLVRRDLFTKLGGFDQAYDPHYWEDVDFCLRLRASGWSILYEPSAAVVHHRNLSFKDASEWQLFAVQHTATVFAEHWGPLLANAAAPDDPPEVLMPVPEGYGLRQLDLSQQLAADFAALERRRLQDYSGWLRDRLRNATARADAEESRRKEVEIANEQLRSELTSLKTYARSRVRTWLRDRPRVHHVVTALRGRRSSSA